MAEDHYCCGGDSEEITWTKHIDYIHSTVDESTLYLCNEWLELVVRLCQQPGLNLLNSPPYLLDTIPGLYEKLQGIITNYDTDYSRLRQIKYLQICICLVISKCQQIKALFDEAKADIFSAESHARHRLSTISLVFSHIFKEMEALFPEHHFTTTFLITKPEAFNWWRSHFGSQTVIPWRTFSNLFQSTFERLSPRELDALHDTVDLTCSNFISVFEFDIFTRLFQPWSNILRTWRALVLLHPGYMSFMTYDQVKVVLARYLQYPGAGSYVYRLSCTKLGQWAIGYVTKDGKILQTILHNKSLAQALLDGERKGVYRFPNGVIDPPWGVLRRLVHSLPQVRLKVSREEHQLYSQMDSTFELCKICNESNKDVQLQPCGHLMCRKCLVKFQSSGLSQTCPFCRNEIKSIEEIVVDPYKPLTDRCQSPLSLDYSLKNASSMIPNCDYSTCGDNVSINKSLLSKPMPPKVPPRYPVHIPTLIATQPDNTFTSSMPRINCETHCATSSCGSCQSQVQELDSTCNAILAESNLNPITRSHLIYAQLDSQSTDLSDSETSLVSNSTQCFPINATKLGSPITDTNTSDIHSTRFSGSNFATEDIELNSLLSIYPDMPMDTASLLLNITKNSLDISARIWKYFQPRSNENEARV